MAFSKLHVSCVYIDHTKIGQRVLQDILKDGQSYNELNIINIQACKKLTI